MERQQFKTVVIRHFYLRRARKILPVAYLFFFVLMLLNYGWNLNIRAPEFFTAFFFLDNFPLRSGTPYTAHLWTLAVEVQFYLLLPLCLAIGQKKYFWFVLAIVVLLPFISIWGYFAVLSKACRYFFWKGPFIILVGSVISLFDINLLKRRRPAFLLSLALLVIALIISSKTFIFYRKYCSEWLAAILIGFVIVLICDGKDMLSRILSYPLIRWVGRVSYSAYIWQQLFIGLHTWQPWLTSMSDWPLCEVLAVKFLGTFALAVLSYYLFETRFLRSKGRIKPGLKF